jgi:phage tail-like protein
MPNPVPETLSSPFINFRFEVLLNLQEPMNGISNPVCSAAFAECNGLDMNMQPRSFNEGGANQVQTHLKGTITYGQLTLNRGMTSTQHLWVWFEAAGTPGINARADGTVTLSNPDGSTAMVFKLFDCLPVGLRGPSLNARSGEIAIEEMQLAYGRLLVGDASASNAGGSVSLSAGFGVGVNAGVSASAGLSVSGGVGLSASASAGFKF